MYHRINQETHNFHFTIIEAKVDIVLYCFFPFLVITLSTYILFILIQVLSHKVSYLD